MPKQTPEFHELSLMARSCFQIARADRELALNSLIHKLSASPRIYKAVHKTLIRRSLRRLILDEARRQREKLTRASASSTSLHDEAQGQEESASEATTEHYSLLTYPLSCSKELGQAVKAEVVAECHMHESLVDSNEARMRWFGLIESSMLDDSSVSENLTHADLREMLKIALGDIK